MAEAVIEFEGRALSVVDGQSVFAALVEHGEVELGTRPGGTPRGGYCGSGVCHECLVSIDGEAGVLACMIAASHGMRVTRQHEPPAMQATSGSTHREAISTADIAHEHVEALVVGAGPAGRAAATVLARRGISVILVDERGAPDDPDRGARARDAGLAQARRAGVVVRQRSTVWGAFREEAALVLGVYSDGRASYLRPRQLIIATGGVERAALLPGWTLPGVMTTGAGRSLVRGRPAAAGRIVVAGNGPANFRLASELARAGAQVVAMVEAAPRPWRRPVALAGLLAARPELALAGAQQLGTLRRAGVTTWWDHRLVAVEGERRAERAVIADRDGRRSVLAVDTVCIGEGFTPANELARLLGCAHRVVGGTMPDLVVERDDFGATSQPDILVVGGAAACCITDVARVQGELAGWEASRRLDRPGSPKRSLSARLHRHLRFQQRSARLFAAAEPALSRATDDTLVCPCEGLALGTLRRRIEARDIADVASLKRLTRAGMGRCQARACGPYLAALVGGASREADFLAPQVPLRPLPVAAIAREKAEWRGHARTPAFGTAAPVLHDDPVTRQAEIVVIGGGIVGLCTALFLARQGGDVVVIDQGRASAMASGGNAGSLHAQLLSFDHRESAGISAAAMTLPLQRDAIALWRVLERELGSDFEMTLTGGLMVAGSRQDLVSLASKVRVEQQQGVACDLIDAAALRALEPALDPGLLGAAYCPDEGKINPLVATDAIASAAVRAGARIVPMTGLRALDRSRGKFRLETTGGIWLASKVVNAAGAFSGDVGRMLGVSLPVFGAPLQMIVTEPLGPLVNRLVMHASRHLTLKQSAHGAILIGGGWTAGLDPVHRRPRPLRRSLEGNLWIAQHVLPALRDARVVRSWAAMNIDIDGAPIVGEHPAIPGFFNAVTSNGYTLGPIIGRITSDLIMRAETYRDVSAFSPVRFDG